MARTKEFIQQHNILDMIANLGDEYQSEGLHVFSASEEEKKSPFQYPFRTDHLPFLC